MDKKTNKDWEEFKKEWSDVVHVFGTILFLPAFITISIAYGIRAGLVAGAEKFLAILKNWSGKE